MVSGFLLLDAGKEESIALFERKVAEFIEAHRGKPAVAFHNGVFGMFEDPKFETGTKAFVAQLKRMKDAGIKVYVGGGEGGTALEKYGQPDWVTHCFTAGGNHQFESASMFIYEKGVFEVRAGGATLRISNQLAETVRIDLGYDHRADSSTP